MFCDHAKFLQRFEDRLYPGVGVAVELRGDLVAHGFGPGDFLVVAAAAAGAGVSVALPVSSWAWVTVVRSGLGVQFSMGCPCGYANPV